MNKQRTYTVKITRNDSTTPVEYTGIWYAWWQMGGAIFVMEKGEKGINREYITYSGFPIDHVHIIEEIK